MKLEVNGFDRERKHHSFIKYTYFKQGPNNSLPPGWKCTEYPELKCSSASPDRG